MPKSPARDILRKALLLGIGAASLTKEAAEGIAKKLKKDYNLNEKEGRKLAADVLKSSRKEFSSASREARKHATRLVRKLDSATREPKSGKARQKAQKAGKAGKKR